MTGIGFFSAVHDVSYNVPYTVSELSALKMWLVSLGIESVCKITDRGSHVKRLVSWNGFFLSCMLSLTISSTLRRS